VETPPEVINLRSEISEAKEQHRRDLERAERRAEDAESRITSVRLEQERRVNNLESRLQELSETIGTYDRLRQHDQQEINKLRQLNIVGSAAASAAETTVVQTSSSSVKEDLSLQELAEEFYRLRSALKKANEASEDPSKFF